MGGAELMNREARVNPDSFFRLRPSKAGLGTALLVAATTGNGTVPREKVLNSVMQLWDAIDQPTAFYVRLLNDTANEFPVVEQFFRQIVDAAIDRIGYRRIEMGTDPTEHGFVNTGIFEQLHYSELAIADVTGLRPNCFIELGYALGCEVPVIVTAMQGTVLPFDQSAIPCHFWNLNADAATNIRKLLEFIEKNIGRPPLVSA
jgi:hypothetical protein